LSGGDKYRTLTRAQFHGAKGILMVYDLSSTLSFINIQSWHNILWDVIIHLELLIEMFFFLLIFCYIKKVRFR
jgi:GTPase SAR1 family protein